MKLDAGWFNHKRPNLFSWDNCIAALVLRCNCMFALVFLTLHVCPWFSKLKAPFAPVCQHRELDLNNCSKKISQKRKKGGKTILPLIPNTLLPSPTRESPPACRRAGLRPPPPHGPEPPRALPARLRRAVRHHQHDAARRGGGHRRAPMPLMRPSSPAGHHYRAPLLPPRPGL